MPMQRNASVEELLTLYRERLAGERHFKALLQVKADLGARGIHTFQAAWRVQNGRTQISGFDLFGRTLFDLRLDAAHFSIDVPSERKVIEGDLETFDESAGEKIPLASRDLIAWVNRRGIPDIAPPHIPALEKKKNYFILYRFIREGEKGRLLEKIWIERTAFRVEKVTLFDRAGRQRGVLEFKAYRQIQGQIFPFAVKGFGRNEEIELTFKEVAFPAFSEGAE